MYYDVLLCITTVQYALLCITTAVQYVFSCVSKYLYARKYQERVDSVLIYKRYLNYGT